MSQTNPSKPAASPKVAFAYALTVCVTMAILLAVIAAGNAIPFSALRTAAASNQTQATGMPNLAIPMTQICLIVLLSRAVGSIVERIGQPRVIGEVLAGLLLGPSVLGWLAPGLAAALFPARSLGFLHAVSQLGLVLFMFMVGLEVDLKELSGQGRAALAISHASIVTPMALGGALSLLLYPRFAGPGRSSPDSRCSWESP